MSVLSPILHVASGTWTIGKIVEHIAKPCSKEEIEDIISKVSERFYMKDELGMLRAALEEVCRCERCSGTGLIWGCNCNGTGRDYHGSEKAKKLLESGK